ncbi:MAG: hypothetical protein ACLQVI_24760 [Polyangiaceae bacterium]
MLALACATCAVVAVGCGGTDGFANDASGEAGAATPTNTGNGNGSSGGSTSGSTDDGGTPQADDGGSVAPVNLGDGGLLPDAASCTNGSAGLLAVIPGGTMAPGMACVSCHASTGAGKLNVAGTVYAAPNEPNLCIGISAGVQVIVTDAQGNDHPLAVNAFGNFYDNSLLGFSFPYTARVITDAGTAPMLTAQTNGDCNACHTAAGTQGAAGRIVGP